MDTGAECFQIWLDRLCVRSGRHYPVFCRPNVYPSGCFPYSFQHTKTRGCSCDEGSAGIFCSNASGLIRGRLDAAAADTETLLAHNLADIVGTIVLFLSMLVMMFLFDWRMGAACLLAAVISVIAMFSMMGGKMPKLMAEYRRPRIA